jgi:hypothetical protein
MIVKFLKTTAAVHRQSGRKLQERILEEGWKKIVDRRRLDPNNPNGLTAQILTQGNVPVVLKRKRDPDTLAGPSGKRKRDNRS